MQFSRLIFLVALLLSPVCLIGTTWLYLYPLFHGCAFPVPPSSPSLPHIAPFRLLALGDPQLEGDSSLPKPDALVFPSLEKFFLHLRGADSWGRRREVIKDGVKGAVTKDIPKWLEGKRKIVDLWGNDFYLAHIVRTLRWWTQPSHVAVLGDLLGSQWISDEEFERRAGRYWGRVFKGMERVPDAVMGQVNEEDEEDEDADADADEKQKKKEWAKTVEVLAEDNRWENRVINIAGNHDVGYAGDMSSSRIERFERAFGKAHWDIVFTLPNTFPVAHSDPYLEDMPTTDPEPNISRPALRVVVLNSMNLDTPAVSESLQAETYDFLNHVISTARPVTDKTHATILLTHIPLHKEPGICVDDPFFDFFHSGSGVKEQNMLSEHASKMILEGVFGLSGNEAAEGQGFGRRGVVINGHDHEGCDVLHYISRPGEVEVREDASTTDETDSLPVENMAVPTVDDIVQNSTTHTVDTSNFTPEPQLSKPLPLPIPSKWRATRLLTSPSTPSRPSTPSHPLSSSHPRLREITLRSMMGDFSGYAGFLSAWFDPSIGENGEWKIEFATCGVGVQHWWWGVHVVDLIALVLAVLGSFTWALERSSAGAKEARRRKNAGVGEGIGGKKERVFSSKTSTNGDIGTKKRGD